MTLLSRHYGTWTSANSLSKHGFEVLESKGPVYRETAQLSMRHGTVYDAAYVGLYEQRTTSASTPPMASLSRKISRARHIRAFKEQETVIDDDDAEGYLNQDTT